MDDSVWNLPYKLLKTVYNRQEDDSETSEAHDILVLPAINQGPWNQYQTFRKV